LRKVKLPAPENCQFFHGSDGSVRFFEKKPEPAVPLILKHLKMGTGGC